MITCSSCNHQNPEGSLQCENCYTPLPATTSCPNCGASVQTDATFCGQCGFNLQAEMPSAPSVSTLDETAVASIPDLATEEISLPDELPLSGGGDDIIPEQAISGPIQSPWDDDSEENPTIAQTKELPTGFPEVSVPVGPDTDFEIPSPEEDAVMPWEADAPESEIGSETEEAPTEFEESVPDKPEVAVAPEVPAPVPPEPVASPIASATQLQVQSASLLHLQSNTTIEIPANLDVVHIGKPNGQIPPDIDVAGFPDSEVVSRIHADIRIESDSYFLEDVGSSNGTYINHAPLLQGNRHRLRPGDRIALGKGDLVTFIFQLD